MTFDASFYSDWGTISIAAAALAVLTSSLLILTSRLFGLKNLEQIAKTEFVYAISTVIIVMIVVYSIPALENELAGSGNSLARCLFLSSFGKSCYDPSTAASASGYTFMCGSGPTDYCNTLIDWMKLYMSTPTKCVTDFIEAAYAVAIPVDAAASIYMEIFMSEHASGFGVKWISERNLNAVQSLTFYLYIYYLLAHIFNFVKFYGGFFFSIGVALRAFPPTRGAGAYVMALAIGLYFVFPLCYILISSMGTNYAQSMIASFDPSKVGDSQFMCSVPEVYNVTSLGCGSENRPLQMIEILQANEEELTSLMNLDIDSFIKHIAFAICLFPMICLVALLTFVLNTTNLFGGNIPEIGRGLVKLI